MKKLTIALALVFAILIALPATVLSEYPYSSVGTPCTIGSMDPNCHGTMIMLPPPQKAEILTLPAKQNSKQIKKHSHQQKSNSPRRPK